MCQNMYKPHSWAPIIKRPLQSGCQQKDGGQPHLLWESMKHNERQTAENNVGGHLLGMSSMLISNGALRRHSQPRDRGAPSRHLQTVWFPHTPANLSPEAVTSGLPLLCWDLGHEQRMLRLTQGNGSADSFVPHSHQQQGDRPNSPMDLFHLGHFLSFPSWVSPATVALKIMKGLHRIILEDASSFGKRRTMESKGGNGEKEVRSRWASRRRENNSKLPLYSTPKADRKW